MHFKHTVMLTNHAAHIIISICTVIALPDVCEPEDVVLHGSAALSRLSAAKCSWGFLFFFFLLQFWKSSHCCCSDTSVKRLEEVSSESAFQAHYLSLRALHQSNPHFVCLNTLSVCNMPERRKNKLKPISFLRSRVICKFVCWSPEAKGRI